MCAKIKRGNIYDAKLEKTKGSVQNGNRPVIIYSCNENNFFSPTVNVIPLTEELKPLCVHVLIEGFGLRNPSMALVEQITTIDKSQLKAKIGTLDSDTLEIIDEAVDFQLGKKKRKKKKEDPFGEAI